MQKVGNSVIKITARYPTSSQEKLQRNFEQFCNSAYLNYNLKIEIVVPPIFEEQEDENAEVTD